MIATPQSRGRAWLLIALGLSCLLPLIFSADSPWIYDEPQLLQAAADANHTPDLYLGVLHLPFTILSAGLQGNRGAYYGPAAEWLYQIMLAILPHDLVLLSAVRAAIVTIATAAGLYWLSRSTGLSLGFAVAIMLSPWLWFYSRQLWDNSLCIPLSVLTLAAYAQFLKSRARLAFALTIVGLFLLLLLHLMAIALVVPLVGHLVIFQLRSLFRVRFLLLAIVVIMGIISVPYAIIFLKTYQPGTPGDSSPLYGWLFPLLGGHHLSAIGLDDPLGPDWMYRAPVAIAFIVSAAAWLSGLVYIAVWIGMFLALRRARKVLKQSPDCTVLDHIATVAFGVWFFQTVLDGSQRVYGMPHYYNATWIAYAIFAWLAVDAMPRITLTRVALPLYGVCQLIVIAFILTRIHIDGGSRSRGYGPTIANQQAIGDVIWQMPVKTEVDPQFSQWQEFPVGYQALKSIRPAANVQTSAPKRAIIEYRNAFPGDARIILVQARLIPKQSTTTRSTTEKSK